MEQPQQQPLTAKFRCAKELESILPRPMPALLGLPDWFKALPQRAFSAVLQDEQYTVKKCPPFIDAMTTGFLMPLVTDLTVRNGEFTWDFAAPSGTATNIPNAPIGFHDASQVAGTPFFEPDRFIIKFINHWTIELPPGYSLLVTHPINRDDLPFRTLTGLVDADIYRDNFIHFPARWHDADFNGVLAKGTPVAQCLPLKRDKWESQIETLPDDVVIRLNETISAIASEDDVYRRRYRAPKQ
jgi:hypothetical protein